MKYSTIPNSELKVSQMCLGTMNFGTPVSEPEAIKLIHAAIDRGVNFIDTANMYEGYTRYAGSPGGIAEKIIGKALKNKRDKVILATKVGMKVGPEPEDEGLSPKALEKQLERSLKRLKTNYVDIYYLHRPDTTVPIEHTIKTITKFMQEGKIRYYGISNYSAEQTEEFLNVCESNNLPRPIVHQPQFSLLREEAKERLFPLLVREKIAAVPYQVLQGGILTGKYKKGKPYPKDSRKAEKPDWVIDLTDTVFNRLEKLEKDAGKLNRTILEHVLKETISIPPIISMVIGVKRIEQLDSIVAILD